MSSLTRVANWDIELVRFEREVVGEPYRIGVTDCATLAHRALYAIYGEKPCCCLPTYATRREMVRAHRETGGIRMKVLDVAERKISQLKARSGDLVTGFSPDAPLGSVGVVVNGNLLTSSEESGVFRAPLAQVDGTFWRVA